MATSLRVVLAANSGPYSHAAVALAEGGYLLRYVTQVTFASQLPRLRLPAVDRRIASIADRRLRPELLGLPMSRVWAAEVAARLLTFADKNPYRAHLAGAKAFDRHLTMRARSADVLHAVGGLGTKSGARLQQRGGLHVSDHRWVHPAIEEQLIRAACQNWGTAPPPFDQGMRKRVERECATADLLVVNSHMAKATYVEEGVAPERVHVLSLGVDTDFYQPNVSVPTNEVPRVLFVGRASPLKGLWELLDAAETFAGELALHVIGTVEPFVRERAEKSRLNVTFSPHLAREGLRAEYQQADFLVMPSVIDSWGMVATEALACGLPVVLSDRVGAQQLVIPPQNGFVYEAGNTGDLEGRLREMLNVRGSWPAMRIAARESVRDQTWKNYVSNFLFLYTQQIAPHFK